MLFDISKVFTVLWVWVEGGNIGADDWGKFV